MYRFRLAMMTSFWVLFLCVQIALGNSLHPPPEVVKSWPTPNYVDPVTKGPALIYVCIIFTSVTFVLVVARLYTRAFLTKALGLDDLLCVIATIMSIVMSVLVIIAKQSFGVGRHIWDFPLSWAAPNRHIAWAGEWFYVIAAACIKCSVLLFYKRLSSPFSHSFKIATYIGIVFNIGYAAGLLLTLCLQCRPAEAYWEQFNLNWLAKGHEFHCIGKEEISLPFSGALSAFGDFYSTLIPLALVWTLRMPLERKLALYALFAVGFVVCAAGCIRIVLLDEVINRTYDPFWVTDTLWIWTAIEINLAIMAACAPALKSFFKHILIDPTAKLVRRAKSSGDENPGTSRENNGHQMEERVVIYNGNRDSKVMDVERVASVV